MTEDESKFQRNVIEYSVSEISLAVKRTVETNFEIVRIRGEVGRLSKPASGHVYLDLKDEKSVISGVIWKGNFSKLEIMPEEGLEVIVTGRLTTFQGQSKYQVIIEKVEHAGVGALMALLEKRKLLLHQEGIFDENRKKKIPFIPDKIGVITSESGAVIQDILQRVNDRFPVEIILWPVSVQGKKSATQIANAIRGFNALLPPQNAQRPDVIIVARGGGSLEDLWGFNEELVVRAVFESVIPIISAVGHETDTTLIDLVADLRAATPSAAAELAVPVRNDLISTVLDLDIRRQRAEIKFFKMLSEKFRDLTRRFPKEEKLFDAPRQYCDEFFNRLNYSIKLLRSTKTLTLKSIGVEKLNIELLRQSVSLKRERLKGIGQRIEQYALNEHKRQKQLLESLKRMLENLSYRNTLKRGYSLVLSPQGDIISSTKDALKHERLILEFEDGQLGIKPEKVSSL